MKRLPIRPSGSWSIFSRPWFCRMALDAAETFLRSFDMNSGAAEIAQIACVQQRTVSPTRAVGSGPSQTAAKSGHQCEAEGMRGLHT